MVEAGQTSVTEVGRAEAPSQEAEVVTGIPHKARAADELVVLVSPRHAVWDRRSASLPKPTDEVHQVTACGPVPTDWTPGLVHCRLVHIVGLMRRLSPPKVPAGRQSFLGNLGPASEASVLPRPLDPAETVRLDWTWDQVICRPIEDRAILQGVMAGFSLRKIAAVLDRLVTLGELDRALKRTRIGDRYREITTAMAKDWQRSRQAIDGATLELWKRAAEGLAGRP